MNLLVQTHRKLSQQASRAPGWFDDDPVELFRRHVWMNPFWEDDVYELVELMGADHVVFGSDWPHIEGLPSPLDYLAEVEKLDYGDRRLVMRDNTRSLTELRPA